MELASIFGIPLPLLCAQLVLGLVNGAFYAILSLGLVVTFGLLRVINIAQGAFYMMGAFVAYILLNNFGLSYWYALVLSPIVVGAAGIAFELLLLRRTYNLDHLYGMMLTFGVTLFLEGIFRQIYGSGGLPYAIPDELSGGINLGFMFLPLYRAWVIVAAVVLCFASVLVIEYTKVGSYLRAATENSKLVLTFGIDVPRLISLSFGVGIAMAALGGVMAAPILQVYTSMGSNLIIVVFAITVIGGMGSVVGAIVTSFAVGILEALTKVYYPEAANTVIFLLMAAVLLIKPSGLFGTASYLADHAGSGLLTVKRRQLSRQIVIGLLMFATTVAATAPTFIYPQLLMHALCLGIFACAFGLVAGFLGLLSLGHAAFFGTASYISAYAWAKLGLDPISGLLLGTIAGAALGLCFGWVALRSHGLYFAMVTLALTQLIYFAALQAPFTNGEEGIQGVPRGELFGMVDLNDALSMYFFVLLIFVASVLLIWRTVNSPFGHVLVAIRENEPRTISLGYNTKRYKLIAFVLSAAISGLAGSTKVLVHQIATLSDTHWLLSADVFLMALIGGLGTVLGPVFGAFLLAGLDHFLSPFGSWITIIQGLVFIACVLAFRGGLLDLFATLYDALTAKVLKEQRSRSEAPLAQAPTTTR
jgi:branched-chain amino acid transport system permease protein